MRAPSLSESILFLITVFILFYPFQRVVCQERKWTEDVDSINVYFQQHPSKGWLYKIDVDVNGVILLTEIFQIHIPNQSDKITVYQIDPKNIIIELLPRDTFGNDIIELRCPEGSGDGKSGFCLTVKGNTELYYARRNIFFSAKSNDGQKLSNLMHFLLEDLWKK